MKCHRPRDKRIGSYFLVLFMSIGFINQLVRGDVFLRLLDSNGEAVGAVAHNTPFILEVTVESVDGNNKTPNIKGIKQLSVHEQSHVSTINTIINGKRSVKKVYRYVVSGADIGIYEIGPAVVDVGGVQESSLVLKVAVQKAVSQSVHNSFLELSVDKDTVFMGEEVQCFMRFFMGKAQQLAGMSKPVFPHFNASEIVGPFSGQKEVDGVLREYVEWRATLTPQQTGILEIPSVAAIYKVPVKRQSIHSLFNFHSFFDDPFEQKQLFSNSLKITVEELPQSGKYGKPFGIGEFAFVSAVLEPPVAKEGEGVVMRLTVRGKGSIQAFPTLTLPDGLRYYESKQSVDEKKSSEREKVYVFEYIIQGSVPKKYIITEQQCSFFNPVKKRYATIQISPLSLTIESLSQKAVPVTQPTKSKKNKKDDTPKASADVDKQTRDVLPAPIGMSSGYTLPWSIFIALVIGFGCLWLSYMAIGSWRRYRQSTQALRIQRKAFKKARKKLKELMLRNRADELYPLFVTLFADRLQQAEESIDQTCMKETLSRDSNFSAQMMSEWDSFYTAIANAKYGSGMATTQTTALFEDAKKWISVLEKIL